MKSTSGVRGIVGKGLTSPQVAAYGAALGTMLKKSRSTGPLVVGRDTRPSGDQFAAAFMAGAQSVGMDVVYLGIVPTPTVELAIKGLKAAGGVCVTASHNPAEWNALKFFNKDGEFINEKQLQSLEETLAIREFAYQTYKKLGTKKTDDSWIEKHIKDTLRLPGISGQSVKRRRYHVVVDAVNGAGSFALPALLERMGVKVTRINCEPNGLFPHEPEPIPKNLRQLSRAVKKHKADLGMACDPDADRLALVNERGHPIGEELTLALAVKQVLNTKKTNVAVNLSTSNVTVDVGRQMGAKVFLARVGEANVVAEMKSKKALIGGEGNGGVIYGALHYGRDSLVGAALVMTLLAKANLPLSEMARMLPQYHHVKSKAELPDDFDKRLTEFEKRIRSTRTGVVVDSRDGVRFDFKGGWLLIRKSNTEPIYRIVAEAQQAHAAAQLLDETVKFFSRK